MRTKVLIALGLLFCILSNGCAQPVNVRIADLLSNPRLYQGKHICTHGVYVSGFEINGLAESTYQEGDAIRLTEPVIWIEGANITSRTDCVRSERLPVTEFCNATVCGILEYGGNYGHVGAYRFQLISAHGDRARGSGPPLDIVSKALYNGSDNESGKPGMVCATTTVLSGSTGCASRLLWDTT